MKRILVLNNDFMFSLNLTELVSATIAYLVDSGISYNFFTIKDRYNTKALISEIQAEINGEFYSIRFREIPKANLTTEEFTERFTNIVERFSPDKLYVNLTSYGVGKEFKDFFSVKCIDSLTKKKIMRNKDITFFSSPCNVSYFERSMLKDCNNKIDAKEFHKQTKYGLIKCNISSELVINLFEMAGLDSNVKKITTLLVRNLIKEVSVSK